MYVYKQTEPMLYTVGFYDPKGTWLPESDHVDIIDAASRVAYLNGQIEKTDYYMVSWFYSTKSYSKIFYKTEYPSKKWIIEMIRTFTTEYIHTEFIHILSVIPMTRKQYECYEGNK